MKTLATVADRQEILSRISSLSDIDERRWGKMTVHQMLCHLNDSYGIGLGEKIASPASGFLQRTLLKWIALESSLRWGKGFPTRPEVEQGKGGSVPIEFRRDREFLVTTVVRFCDHLPDPPHSHPIFGPMSRQDWWRWGYLHADHHLRQFGR